MKRTPLYELHKELGARLVPFAGYEMPVQFPTGILVEHAHTRRAAGLFDVSHMGQVRLTAKPGQNAAKALETLVPGDIAGLQPGQQRYTQFTNDAGGILDDLMVTSTGDHLLLVVNAAMIGLVAFFLKGFEVRDFVAAFLCWVVVSLTSWVVGAVLGR